MLTSEGANTNRLTTHFQSVCARCNPARMNLPGNVMQTVDFTVEELTLL